MEETRRGRKHPREETTGDGGGEGGGGGGGGYYADPMSPIASTPMKRPRTKPANTKSAKGKQAAVASPSLSAAQKEEERKFFSPRKLAKEYDDVDDDVDENGDEKKPKKRKLNTVENADANEEKKKPAMEKSDDVKARNSSEKQGDDLAAVSANGTTETVMFSPVLKVPRGTRSPSGGNSPVREAHARLDSAFASAASSNTTTPEKQDKEESVGVHCEESSIASEEAEASSEVSSDNEFNPFVFMKSLPKYDDLVPNGRATVLPAKTKHSPDVCLVLDLDETLVHCTVDPVENAHLQFPVNFNGVDYTVNVKKRPHMEYFLKQVSKRFEVVVFTASHRAYAEKLLNLIDPHRELIKYRLYREDCLDVYGNYLKDLTVLGRHLSKVVLVDNSPHAFGYQVNNGIPIETWYDDEKDDELLNLLPFLESLLETDDVRPVVEKQFQIQKLIDSLPDEFN